MALASSETNPFADILTEISTVLTSYGISEKTTSKIIHGPDASNPTSPWHKIPPYQIIGGPSRAEHRKSTSDAIQSELLVKLLRSLYNDWNFRLESRTTTYKSRYEDGEVRKWDVVVVFYVFVAPGCGVGFLTEEEVESCKTMPRIIESGADYLRRSL